MASALPGPVSAVQVGSYFLGQYYHFLQRNPNLAHQFYTEASTMIRYDGVTNENASGMEEIHNRIINLNFTEIEIKTANSLESLDGGVLVMVTGLVQVKDFICRRKFAETFFLAPQEKGYFVLNDIFLLLEEEQVLPHSVATHDDYDSNLDTLNSMEEPVPSYTLEEDIPTDYLISTSLPDDNNSLDNFGVSGEPNQTPDPEEIVDETPAELPTISFSSVSKAAQDPPAPVQEPVGEPPKHTYASILRTSKAQAAPHLTYMNKTGPVMAEWHHAPQATQQQVQPIVPFPDKSSSEALDEVSTFEDEGDSKSVYVGNLPASISSSDLEQEFSNFGRIKPDGVTIRSRKDAGFFYAFIEFEDAFGVQNALKASPVQLNGRLIHVEGRRPNSGASRGRRGRGRGGHISETSRGRFGGGGRSFENDRPKGNGYLQRGSRHEYRGIQES